MGPFSHLKIHQYSDSDHNFSKNSKENLFKRQNPGERNIVKTDFMENEELKVDIIQNFNSAHEQEILSYVGTPAQK